MGNRGRKGASKFLNVWKPCVARCGCAIAANTRVRHLMRPHAATSTRVDIVCPICREPTMVRRRYIRGT
jgi:hypothetical protein